MKTKTFDCVEMKRRGSLRVHEQLKGLTVEQQIEFWRQRNEQFLQNQEQLHVKAEHTKE